RELDRRKKMRVDIADPEAEQPMGIDEEEDVLVPCGEALRQILNRRQNGRARVKTAERDLPDHKGMAQSLSRMEQACEDRVGLAQVIDPYGGIDQDHAGSGRRLCGACAFG